MVETREDRDGVEEGSWERDGSEEEEGFGEREGV